MGSTRRVPARTLDHDGAGRAHGRRLAHRGLQVWRHLRLDRLRDVVGADVEHARHQARAIATASALCPVHPHAHRLPAPPAAAIYASTTARPFDSTTASRPTARIRN